MAHTKKKKGKKQKKNHTPVRTVPKHKSHNDKPLYMKAHHNTHPKENARLKYLFYTIQAVNCIISTSFTVILISLFIQGVRSPDIFLIKPFLLTIFGVYIILPFISLALIRKANRTLLLIGIILWSITLAIIVFAL